MQALPCFGAISKLQSPVRPCSRSTGADSDPGKPPGCYRAFLRRLGPDWPTNQRPCSRLATFVTFDCGHPLAFFGGQSIYTAESTEFPNKGTPRNIDKANLLQSPTMEKYLGSHLVRMTTSLQLHG